MEIPPKLKELTITTIRGLINAILSFSEALNEAEELFSKDESPSLKELLTEIKEGD